MSRNFNRVAVQINFESDGENITTVLAPKAMTAALARTTVEVVLNRQKRKEDDTTWELVWETARPELEALGFDYLETFETVEVE